jgi:hypothetical protein
MTADAWRICPNCVKLYNFPYVNKPTDIDEDQDKTGDYYPRTMREDYDIYVAPDGKFVINFRCSCHVCKFTKTYLQRLDIFQLPDRPIL